MTDTIMEEEQLATTPQKPDTPQTGPLAILRRYLRDSSGLLNSLILVVPLFVIYQIGVLTTGGIQNGVDFITSLLYWKIFDGNALYYILFNLGLLAVLALTIFFLRKKQRFHPRTFLFVILESTVYGLSLGTLVNSILNLGSRGSLTTLAHEALASGVIDKLGPWDSFVLSLGAGFYEELVFRLIMLSGLVWISKSILQTVTARSASLNNTWEAGKDLGLLVIAKRCLFGPAQGPEAPPKLSKFSLILVVTAIILLTSVIFSGIHYVGELGDPFTLHSFLFRFVAGVIFALLYYLRGFAVAVYTHAIYDVLVLVF